VAGLGVALSLMPDHALLNDINAQINFYSWLKRGLRISVSMENEPEFFYRYHRRFNELIAKSHADSREAASLFDYLNRML